MPNKCDVCGQEFYSDVEFQTHLLLEGTKVVSRHIEKEWNWIASGLLAMNILAVQRRDHCDLPTAIKTFYEETRIISRTWNQFIRANDGVS